MHLHRIGVGLHLEIVIIAGETFIRRDGGDVAERLDARVGGAFLGIVLIGEAALQ